VTGDRPVLRYELMTDRFGGLGTALVTAGALAA